MTDLDLILQAAGREADGKRAFGESYHSPALIGQAHELQAAIDRVRANRVEVPIPRDGSGLEQLRATIARDGDYVTTEYMDLGHPLFEYRTGHIGMKTPTRRGNLVYADIVVVTNDGIRAELHRVEVGKLQSWANDGIERAQ